MARRSPGTYGTLSRSWGLTSLERGFNLHRAIWAGSLLGELPEGNLSILYLTYGLIAGTGVGLGYIAPVVALPGWFPDRPGLAYGIAVCGFGAGPAIGVPTANYLISSTGGPLQTFGILGIAYVVLVGGAALFMKNPQDHEPDGRRPYWRESYKVTERRSWDFRGALRTWQWYAMWIMLLLNATAGLAIISDAKAMAAEVGGASAFLASTFVVLVALADVAGRLFWPTLTDRIGTSHVFLIMFLLQAVALLVLPLLGAGRFTVFAIFASIVLTCYGGGYGVMPPLVDAYYGPSDVGSIYGGKITASGVAAFGAPLLLAALVDMTGSYSPSLYVTAGAMLKGAVITLAIRPLSALLLSGSQPHRASPFEDKALPKEDRSPHQGGAHRGDGSSIGGCKCPGRKGVLRSLSLPNPGAATMKGAVRG